MTAWSEVSLVLEQMNVIITGSNPAQHRNVCPSFVVLSCVCVDNWQRAEPTELSTAECLELFTAAEHYNTI
jgi:hypothetical protein